MKELVKISENNGKRAVSAKELHKSLKSKTRFDTWFNYRKKQYDLIEGVDYQSLAENSAKPQGGRPSMGHAPEGADYQSFSQISAKPKGGRPSMDYALTINCAKELAMIENNAQGKKIRRHFIQMEEERNMLLMAEPIGGVYPIIHNGQIGYPRREILIAAGYSPSSGTVWELKNRFPDDFYTILRTACVSPEFANLRYEQGKVRQLEINFREKRSNKGLKGGDV